MFYKLLKLVNGDSIIAATDDDCSTLSSREFIEVLDPVLISPFRYPKNGGLVETYVLQPWIKIAISDLIKIPTKSIVVAVDIQDNAIDQYLEYVKDTKALDLVAAGNSLSETSEEGSDISLEDFLRDLVSGESEEEDEDGIRTRTDSRTIH